MTVGTYWGAKRGWSHFGPWKTFSHPANKSALGPQNSTSIISYCDSIAKALSQSLATCKAKPSHSIISEKTQYRAFVITQSKVKLSETLKSKCFYVWKHAADDGMFSVVFQWREIFVYSYCELFRILNVASPSRSWCNKLDFHLTFLQCWSRLWVAGLVSSSPNDVGSSQTFVRICVREKTCGDS